MATWFKRPIIGTLQSSAEHFLGLRYSTVSSTEHIGFLPQA